jgi:ABC-2 type transport system permease protein
MFNDFLFAFKEELQEIKNSWYRLGLLTFFPLLCFGIIAIIFHEGVARDLPIAVVDYDKSSLSRKVLFDIDASSTVTIAQHCHNVKEAKALLQKGEVYAVIVIGKNFLKDVYLKKAPKITALLNTQYILISKIIKAALLETTSYASGSVELGWQLSKDEAVPEAMSDVAPIKLYVAAFFNTYKNYFYFLVSALLPSIWQIFIVIGTIVSFGTLFKAKKEKEFFKNGSFVMKILGKLFPATLAYFLLGAGYIFYIYGFEPWPFEGSVAVMLFAILLTTIAYQAVALFLFVTGFDYARALSLGAVYTAPAFAFLGITFPIYSMNDFAIFWRDMLPVSYLVEIQIALANYGASPLLMRENLEHIALFLLFFIPVFIRFKMRLAK